MVRTQLPSVLKVILTMSTKPIIGGEFNKFDGVVRTRTQTAHPYTAQSWVQKCHYGCIPVSSSTVIARSPRCLLKPFNSICSYTRVDQFFIGPLHNFCFPQSADITIAVIWRTNNLAKPTRIGLISPPESSVVASFSNSSLVCSGVHFGTYPTPHLQASLHYEHPPQFLIFAPAFWRRR